MPISKIKTSSITADAASINLNIDANTLYLDAANNRVGIGTTSPGATLQVQGATTLASGNFTVDTAGSLSTQGNTLCTSVPNGGVGINSTPSGGIGLYLTNKAGNTSWNSLYVAGIASQTSIVNVANSSGSSLFNILGSGNVGIGSTSPEAKLHVLDSTNGGTIQLGSTTVDNGTSRVNLYGSDNYIGFRHRNVNSGNDLAYVRGIPGNLGTDSSGVLIFGTSPAAGTVAERMRITPTGQLGLGTSSVGTNFRQEIAGLTGSNDLPATSGTTQAASGILRLGGNGFTAVLDIGSAGAVAAWIQATDRGNLATKYPLLINPNGGGVGVGTTSPTAPLHVARTAQITDIDSSDQVLVLENTSTDTSGNLTGIRFRQSNGTNAGQTFIGMASTGASATRGSLIFAPPNTSGNATERMRIDSSGNVLVGGTSQNTANNPVYSKTTAKVFVGWAGSNGAVLGTPFNVSSVTRNSAGSYTVNFTNALASVNYTVTTGFQRIATSDFVQFVQTQSTTSTARFESFSGGSSSDFTYIYMTAFL